MDDGTTSETVDESRPDDRSDPAPMRHDVYMRDDSPYRICFVCSGNICRSPMAEVVMARLVDRAGLSAVVLVDSAGTGDWHIGERADRRAVQTLAARGYDGATHRAKQFDPAWFTDVDQVVDLVVALDRGHQRTLRAWAPDDTARDRIHLLRAFDPGVVGDGHALDVADPYYDGLPAFERVLDQIEAACAGLLLRVKHDLFEGAPVPTGPASLPAPPTRLDLTGAGSDRRAAAVAGPADDDPGRR